MVIRILDIVAGADTAAQGAAVFVCLQKAMADKDTQVVIDFNGVKTATSSFVNVGFVQLLSSFSLAEIRARLRVVGSSRQINDMIRSRLERESAAAA